MILFYALNVGKSKEAPVVIDEIPLVEASDSLSQHSRSPSPDTENQLPTNVVAEVTFIRQNKSICKPDQHTLDPSMDFMSLKQHMIAVLADNGLTLTRNEKVEFGWKWEKRILQQSTTKKPVESSYFNLCRDGHWEAVWQVLYEANAQKNGRRNMLLRIQVNIILEEDDVDFSGPSANTIVFKEWEVFVSLKLLILVRYFTSARKSRKYA